MDISRSEIRIINTVVYFSKIDPLIQCNPKSPSRPCVENDSLLLNCIWRCKKPRIAKVIFKKEKCWRWLVRVCSGGLNETPRTGWLPQTPFPSPQVGKLDARVPRGPFLCVRAPHPLCSEGHQLCWTRAPLSRPLYPPSPPHRPCRLIPSHWGLGFTVWTSGKAGLSPGESGPVGLRTLLAGCLKAPGDSNEQSRLRTLGPNESPSLCDSGSN